MSNRLTVLIAGRLSFTSHAVLAGTLYVAPNGSDPNIAGHADGQAVEGLVEAPFVRVVRGSGGRRQECGTQEQ